MSFKLAPIDKFKLLNESLVFENGEQSIAYTYSLFNWIRQLFFPLEIDISGQLALRSLKSQLVVLCSRITIVESVNLQYNTLGR